mgnify:CR=1 FL=1
MGRRRAAAHLVAASGWPRPSPACGRARSPPGADAQAACGARPHAATPWVQRRALRPRRPARWLATVRSTAPSARTACRRACAGPHVGAAAPAAPPTASRRLASPAWPDRPRRWVVVGRALLGLRPAAGPLVDALLRRAMRHTAFALLAHGEPSARRPRGAWRVALGGRAAPSRAALAPRASARGDSVVGLAVRWPRVITPGALAALASRIAGATHSESAAPTARKGLSL